MNNFPVASTGSSTPFGISPSDIYVQVDVKPLYDLFAHLTPRNVGLAAQRAANRTRDWLLTQMSRELAQRAALPVNGLRGRFRRGRKKALQQDGAGYAILWIGLNAIEAQRAGVLRQTKKGTRAGRHFFDRAFVARIYNGTEKVWRRKNFGKGSGRWPVVKMTIPIDEIMEEILPQYQAAAERMFSQRLEHEIKYLIGLAAQ